MGLPDDMQHLAAFVYNYKTGLYCLHSNLGLSDNTQDLTAFVDNYVSRMGFTAG